MHVWFRKRSQLFHFVFSWIQLLRDMSKVPLTWSFLGQKRTRFSFTSEVHHKSFMFIFSWYLYRMHKCQHDMLHRGHFCARRVCAHIIHEPWGVLFSSRSGNFPLSFSDRIVEKLDSLSIFLSSVQFWNFCLALLTLQCVLLIFCRVVRSLRSTSPANASSAVA